jgi:hypothetical protein
MRGRAGRGRRRPCPPSNECSATGAGPARGLLACGPSAASGPLRQQDAARDHPGAPRLGGAGMRGRATGLSGAGGPGAGGPGRAGSGPGPRSVRAGGALRVGQLPPARAKAIPSPRPGRHSGLASASRRTQAGGRGSRGRGGAAPPRAAAARRSGRSRRRRAPASRVGQGAGMPRTLTRPLGYSQNPRRPQRARSPAGPRRDRLTTLRERESAAQIQGVGRQVPHRLVQHLRTTRPPPCDAISSRPLETSRRARVTKCNGLVTTDRQSKKFA